MIAILIRDGQLEMVTINLEKKAKRLDIVIAKEPDHNTWTDTVLSIAVQVQGLKEHAKECVIDISSLHSLTAYSKERIFALRDLFLKQGFQKVTFQVATINEAMRMNHKRRAEVLSGSEEYLFAPLAAA